MTGRKKEERFTTSIRIPASMIEEIRAVAEREERQLNTQILRYIRYGMDVAKERGLT